ncbi:MAG: transposase [Chloroflexi bacterium]|nr:transposase [Chloroflexota bacterium]
MKKTILKKRSEAVKRYLADEPPRSICSSLRKSKAWLYKWVKRFHVGDSAWCQDQSKQPHLSPNRTTEEIEEIVKMVRLSLYNKDLFCGDQAIFWELEHMQIQPLPSLRTINRILSRHGLTHRRTGRYEPKGKLYPQLPALVPNQTHQMDLVGPCYLQGPLRFYSLNTVDVSINRCGIQPTLSRSSQSILDALWAVWKRMGIPQNIQVDNDMAFYGSAAHPRGMGALIRLCLLYGVQLWFIPISEPWRNGVVEKFNDHYRQKFLKKTTMTSVNELQQASLVYENKHNSSYRYSKLKGKTPLAALAHSEQNLVFPNPAEAPRHPLEKPESGRYHHVRFIRSDLRLNIFGEFFPAPPETQYEYVVATVDVKERKLKLFLGINQVEEYRYD